MRLSGGGTVASRRHWRAWRTYIASVLALRKTRSVRWLTIVALLSWEIRKPASALLICTGAGKALGRISALPFATFATRPSAARRMHLLRWDICTGTGKG